jgi:hypothetical protein
MALRLQLEGEALERYQQICRLRESGKLSPDWEPNIEKETLDRHFGRLCPKKRPTRAPKRRDQTELERLTSRHDEILGRLQIKDSAYWRSELRKVERQIEGLRAAQENNAPDSSQV